MAQVIAEVGDERGVLFDGREELERLKELMEWGLTTTTAVGVPVYVLGQWLKEVEAALRGGEIVIDEAELEEEEMRELRGEEKKPPKRFVFCEICKEFSVFSHKHTDALVVLPEGEGNFAKCVVCEMPRYRHRFIVEGSVPKYYCMGHYGKEYTLPAEVKRGVLRVGVREG